MSLFDKLLEIGSTPDWISPLVGISQDIAHGGGDVLRFHRSISISEAICRLDRAGIEHWNDYIDGDYGIITVSRGQGAIAKKIIGV